MKISKKALKRLLPSSVSFLLIAVFLCLSLIAFSGMNRSTAWYSQNTNVSAEQIGIELRGLEDVQANITSYAISEISDDMTQYTKTNTLLTVIPTHDPNNISYNQYQKALLVAVELMPHKDMTVNLSLHSPYSEIIDRSSTGHFSDCIQIRPVTMGASDIATVSGEAQAFVTSTADGSALQKVTQLSLAQSVQLTKDTPHTLYYVIEYNPTFLNHLKKLTLLIDSISFANDIHFVVVAANQANT